MTLKSLAFFALVETHHFQSLHPAAVADALVRHAVEQLRGVVHPAGPPPHLLRRVGGAPARLHPAVPAADEPRRADVVLQFGLVVRLDGIEEDRDGHHGVDELARAARDAVYV